MATLVRGRDARRPLRSPVADRSVMAGGETARVPFPSPTFRLGWITDEPVHAVPWRVRPPPSASLLRPASPYNRARPPAAGTWPCRYRGILSGRSTGRGD